MDNFQAPAIPRLIPGFPYTQKFCPYCERELILVNATHLYDAPEHYKAIMICYNFDCGYIDMPCREAYVKAYYSSQLAADRLWSVLLSFERPARGPVQYDELPDEDMQGIEGVYFQDEKAV